jgi:hypothetical protein
MSQFEKNLIKTFGKKPCILVMSIGINMNIETSTNKDQVQSLLI